MRLGIGATDSMWPKKRRIRLRVLKAVAILRPRRFKGGETPAAFSELAARQPLTPSVAEGHLSERTFAGSARRRGSRTPLPSGERLGEGVTHPVSPPHLTSPPRGRGI